MRNGRVVLWALIVWAVPTVAQQPTVAVLEPSNPVSGQKAVVTYHTESPAATLKAPGAMIAEILIVGDEEPRVIEPVLKKSGSMWTGSFQVPPSGAQLILYRFRAGDLLDDNGADVWRALVYGADGKPVRGAYLARATAEQYPMSLGFKLQKDSEAAAEDITKELSLYPDNYRANIFRWQMMGRAAASPDAVQEIRAELDVLVAKHAADQEAMADLLSWYDRIGEREKADSLRASYIDRDPKGKVAESARQTRIYQERDAATRVRLIEEFLVDFPQEGSALENLQMQLFTFASRANDVAKAEAVLAQMEHPSGQYYNSLAWPLIEKGENLEQAVRWAQRGVDLTDPTDVSQKPDRMATADWKQNTKYARAMVLDTYGFGLMKLGKLPEAQRAFDEALTLNEYQDPEVNERAVECFLKGKKYEKAQEVALTSVRKGKSNDKVMEYLTTAYVAAHGSEKGLANAVREAEEAAQKALAEKLQTERINTPAIDFTLKTMNGESLRLSDLRGKIVVIDFWATWCGPCIQSFPYLQQVYDKHKNDGDIVILAVNTWESKTGDDLLAHVKDFMAKNKYTFPVLMDQGFVEKYGVEGIPTKFIVDQNGKIQFKDIGFGGGDEMMQKMEMQFDLLRKGSL